MNTRSIAALWVGLILIPFSLVRATGIAPHVNAPGKSLFLNNKCNKCHTIQSQGIERDGVPPASTGKPPPDLSTVGLKHNADWMQKWLMKEEELNGKKHIKKFGGTDDELKAITTWLASLKQSAATPPLPKPTASAPVVAKPATPPPPAKVVTPSPPVATTTTRTTTTTTTTTKATAKPATIKKAGTATTAKKKATKKKVVKKKSVTAPKKEGS